MSRRGNCYDNVVIDSFWHGLKNESVYRQHVATRAEATAAIVDDIEVFYNRFRLHSAIGYVHSTICRRRSARRNLVSVDPLALMRAAGVMIWISLSMALPR